MHFLNATRLSKVRLSESQKKIMYNMYVFTIVIAITLLAANGYCEGWDDLGDEGTNQLTQFSQGTAGAAITGIGLLSSFGIMAFGKEGSGRLAAKVAGAGVGIGSSVWLSSLFTGIGKSIGN